MDWADIVTKIGVGACLGFGIITLAKLVRKKNDQGKKTSDPGSEASRSGTESDEH